MKDNLVIKTANYPYSVGIAITNKCNLHCIHCNMNSGQALKDELSKKEYFKLIDELKANKVQKISFFGGEPLIREDFFDIANYAHDSGIFVNVTTNALLLTDSIIENELYKFEMVRVSLDGPNAETHEFIRNKNGIFEKTINNIKKMVENGVNVGVVTCISHKNIKYLKEMIQLLTELKIKRWFIPLLSTAGRGSSLSSEVLLPHEIKEFLIELEKLTKDVNFIINLDLPYTVLLNSKKNNIKASCPAAITELTIFANGDVSPCCEIPVIGGNIRKNTIKDIWNNSDVFKNFRNRSLIQGKCSKCSYLMNCGGCRANAYIKYKNYLEGDDACWKN